MAIVKDFTGFVEVYREKSTDIIHLGTPYADKDSHPFTWEYDCAAFERVGTAVIGWDEGRFLWDILGCSKEDFRQM